MHYHRKILLGLTGSVATILAKELIEKLSELGEVRAVVTECGRYFLRIKHGELGLPGNKIHEDEDEWLSYQKIGDPVLHIELRKWANAFVIAPLSANSLAKIAYGLSDNLLTCVYRCWDWNKPLIVAPAMNTFMWDNDLTRDHLGMLPSKVKVVKPVEKILACGDYGIGAMAPIDVIFKELKEALTWQFPLKNCHGIPVNHHPGAFGFQRKNNYHTGVDLYCQPEEPVHAVEDGVVVHVADFTGPKMGHNWWNHTMGVMVEGTSGVVNYGEIIPAVRVGQQVCRGDLIGRVETVLLEGKERSDIPGHSRSMLHMELYKPGARDFVGWKIGTTRDESLLDPTPFLLESKGRPVEVLSWNNPDRRTVG